MLIDCLRFYVVGLVRHIYIYIYIYIYDKNEWINQNTYSGFRTNIKFFILGRRVWRGFTRKKERNITTNAIVSLLVYPFFVLIFIILSFTKIYYFSVYIYIYIYIVWYLCRLRVLNISVRVYIPNFYHLKFSDYYLHLYCYIQNISVDASFDLLQVLYVELGSLQGTLNQPSQLEIIWR